MTPQLPPISATVEAQLQEAIDANAYQAFLAQAMIKRELQLIYFTPKEALKKLASVGAMHQGDLTTLAQRMEETLEARGPYAAAMTLTSHRYISPIFTKRVQKMQTRMAVERLIDHLRKMSNAQTQYRDFTALLKEALVQKLANLPAPPDAHKAPVQSWREHFNRRLGPKRER